MTVIVDVRRVVRVLRQLSVREIDVELVGVDDLCASRGVVSDVVEADERAVLAEVRSLVASSVALVRQVLLVGLPRYAARLKQIGQVRLVQVVNAIVEDHPMVSTNCERFNTRGGGQINR